MFLALSELSLQPARQLHPERDRHRKVVLQHPRDLLGQPRLLAGEPQPHGQEGAGDGRAVEPGHDARRIYKGKT